MTRRKTSSKFGGSHVDKVYGDNDYFLREYNAVETGNFMSTARKNPCFDFRNIEAIFLSENLVKGRQNTRAHILQ